MTGIIAGMADEPSKLEVPTPEVGTADIARYRAMLRSGVRTDAEFVEIGGPGVVRRAWRISLWVGALLAVTAVFVYLFYHFTNDLRIALVVVAAMLIYMLGVSTLAEGRLED